MPRSVLFLLCVAGGVLVIGWALLAPAHFRSVDERVIERISEGTPSLVKAGLSQPNKSVVALHLQAAERLQLPRREPLAEHWSRLPLQRHSAWHIPIAPEKPVISTFIVTPNHKLREVRGTNTSFEAATVLRTARMTNLTTFAPSGTAAGQPFEASILITAALLKNGAATPALQSDILQLMARGNAAEIESFYLDMLALARRLNWDQIRFLFQHFGSVEAMSGFAESLRHFESELPILFSAVAMAERPVDVTRYVLRFGGEGVRDLELALNYGKGGLDYLVSRQVPVWHSNLRDKLLEYNPFYPMYLPLLHLSVKSPAFAIFFKYALIFAGGFLLALAIRFSREPSGKELGYVWFSELRLVRQGLVGLLMIMLVISLGEPYLAQGEQKVEPAPKINLSVVLGSVAPPPQNQTTSSGNNMIDQYTILALVMFLVLQGIVYVLCLLKLGEIRKQPLTSALKIRLLDNEENLFDSGLYLGLFGTVASLVFLALGILKPSLVAAYSSTLFGILFVAILKIGHVRPYKRRLLLEVDSHSA